MVDDSMFTPAPAPSLTDADVISYLVQLQAKNWQVYKVATGQYYIPLTEVTKVFIERRGEGQWSVSAGVKPTPLFPVGEATDLLMLRSFVEKQLSTSSPTSALLYADTPFDNLSKFAGFITGTTIQALFDPYFDDKSLAVLTTLLTMSGAQVDPSIRFLTAASMITIPSRGVPRLTKTAVDAWLQQMGALGTGEVRHKGYIGHQRRFTLLSGGITVIHGNSANKPFVNEHVHIDNNPEHRRFFDQEWQTATPF